MGSNLKETGAAYVHMYTSCVELGIHATVFSL